MRIIPDTPVWIDYFRLGPGGPAGELDRLLGEETVLICGPVEAELIGGALAEDRERLHMAISGLPWVDLDRGAWRSAGEIGFELRRRGASLPLSDLLIAAGCVRAGARLWTRNGDFRRIKEILPRLDLYQVS